MARIPLIKNPNTPSAPIRPLAPPTAHRRGEMARIPLIKKPKHPFRAVSPQPHPSMAHQRKRANRPGANANIIANVNPDPFAPTIRPITPSHTQKQKPGSISQSPINTPLPITRQRLRQILDQIIGVF
ncbi:MAG: hypothetical protein H6668_01530 [Ardenticatenaceae bacterium]|nr:hypothetical protein [Ardenticatenaceae bacterium]